MPLYDFWFFSTLFFPQVLICNFGLLILFIVRLKMITIDSTTKHQSSTEIFLLDFPSETPPHLYGSSETILNIGPWACTSHSDPYKKKFRINRESKMEYWFLPMKYLIWYASTSCLNPLTSQ